MQEENDNLRTVLAATGNQRNGIVQSATPTQNNTLIDSHSITHTGQGDIIGRDQINNITNNITVNCAYHENIDHIKKLTVEELRSKIGFLPDLSTHVKLFDLIRTAADHPENHTMLLPALDGKTIHYKTEDGWQSAPYQQRMLEAFVTDNKFLINKIPESKQDQEFYFGYLLGSQFRAQDDYLKPYYEACRKSLHGNTVRLAESHSDFQRSNDEIIINHEQQHAATSSLSFQELKDLEEHKLRIAKEMADIRFKEAELRMKEKEMDYKILLAKQQAS